jgi:transcriptional regulator with PAS, ATPase and Fis domain
MPESTQVKLLRVLESGQFRRVGGEEDLRCEARLISATNRDPARAIADGLLREDLFYRICQFEIPVPPLRDRGEDIVALARRFMSEHAQQSGRSVRLGEDAEAVLRQYHWPGNVRELRHVIHNACRLCRSVITPAHLPQLRAQTPTTDESGLGIVPGMSLEEAERRLILATLDAENGDRERCARLLGISVRTLYNRLKLYRSAGTSSWSPGA